MLLRFHWWCMRQAGKYDRPSHYPLTSRVFDWIGGRAANIHRLLTGA